MRFLRRSLVGLFLMSLTAALLVAGGYKLYSAFQERLARESKPAPARERQFAVNAITVEPTRLEPVLSTYGEVEASRTLELRMPLGGRIVELSERFEEGGAVKAGEVLMRVDPADAAAALRVSQADLQEAQAELSEAERALLIAVDDLEAARAQTALRTAALERQQNLQERGVGSASAVETAALAEASARQAVLSKRQSLANAEARVDQAKTGVLRAEIALEEAKRSLDDTTLVAEFDGVLTGVVGALGGIVNANEQVGTLISPDALQVAFRISTQQYSRLVDGQRGLPRLPVVVSLDVAGVDLTATGEVTRESAAVGDGQTGRLLFARLDQAAGLRPGDFVNVRLNEPALENVARLPASAVDAADTVLAITEESRLEVLDAPVLRRQGDDVIVEASAIAGRQIVAERSPLLGAGIRVRVNGAARSEREGAAAQGPSSDAQATVALTPERREKLIAFVDGNTRMPEEARARIKEQLAADEVPAELVTRLESRMGS
ncbi:efflux RND transporter periplasmic adaptor subunit [Celeribacter sp.]|uniref:efflux RND transporter periplasmic adaptor subunit n=1 Tax=Celeribacter sp. TaxID=1890673 RepID=UPI003A8FA062